MPGPDWSSCTERTHQSVDILRKDLYRISLKILRPFNSLMDGGTLRRVYHMPGNKRFDFVVKSC